MTSTHRQGSISVLLQLKRLQFLLYNSLISIILFFLFDKDELRLVFKTSWKDWLQSSNLKIQNRIIINRLTAGFKGKNKL